jgi:hypothetical protein
LSEPRKHHYVPVFYQKHFTNSSGLLWVYDRARKTYQQLAPKVICCEKDLYAINHAKAPKDQRVESLALATADGICASSLKQVITGLIVGTSLPDSAAIADIAYFVGLQCSRLPSTRDYVSSIYKTGAEEIMRLTTVSVGRMKSVLDQYARDTGNAVSVSPESMVEAVHGKHLEVVVTERPFIDHMFKQAGFLSRECLKMSWEILTAPGGTGFLLCDDPQVIVPAKGCPDVGIRIPGAIKYLPLSRDRCLRMGAMGTSLSYRPVDENTVEVVNLNIAANSIRFIMGPDRHQLERVVKKSGSVKPDTTPRFVNATFNQTDSGSTQMIGRNPGRYFYAGVATTAP